MTHVAVLEVYNWDFYGCTIDTGAYNNTEYATLGWYNKDLREGMTWSALRHSGERSFKIKDVLFSSVSASKSIKWFKSLPGEERLLVDLISMVIVHRNSAAAGKIER